MITPVTVKELLSGYGFDLQLCFLESRNIIDEFCEDINKHYSGDAFEFRRRLVFLHGMGFKPIDIKNICCFFIHPDDEEHWAVYRATGYDAFGKWVRYFDKYNTFLAQWVSI